MSLAEHLDELRTRVMRSVIAIAIAFVVGWAFHRTLASWVFQPYDRATAMLNAEIEERLQAGGPWLELFTPELWEPGPGAITGIILPAGDGPVYLTCLGDALVRLEH